MQSNSAQVERALTQFEAQALPDDHPVVPQLASMFGDHSFFIDSGGLNVLEPSETSKPEAPVGMIVNLAYWSDETLTKLSPHEPEPTGVIVSLEIQALTPGAKRSFAAGPVTRHEAGSAAIAQIGGAVQVSK